MLTTEQFEQLIANPETSTIDYKRSMYDFSNSEGTPKLVKDIICLANTIRNQSAYVIFGVDEKEDGSKELIGITLHVDDAMLQDKIKDKVDPIPKFSYYSLKYQDKIFGVLEIPIRKYHFPISPIVNLKGLQANRVYYRSGTMNTEAFGREVLSITNWLQSLPETNESNSLGEEVAQLIKRLSIGEEKLSSIISDIYKVAKTHNLKDLLNFSMAEIQGMPAEIVNANPELFRYRLQIVKVSPDTIEVNPYMNISSAMIKAEMDKLKNFYDYNLIFNFSISKIEHTINELNKSDLYTKMTMSSEKILPHVQMKHHPLNIYIFKNSYNSLYTNIRQKAIDLLFKSLSQ